MLRLSDESLRLASTFRAYRNDVDIYTEDNDKDKEFYKVLFRRLIKTDITINDVTPLGCKANVIKACQEEPKNGRKKIFLVDGDINVIHGRRIAELDNLFVLDAYSIENFLIDKETVIHYLYLNCATKPKSEIETELNYENWLGKYSKKLIELFIHFAIIDFYGGRFTLYNANKYHTKDGNSLLFNWSLIDDDIAILKAEILSKIDITEYKMMLENLCTKWDDSIETLLTIVSGKNYIIPLLIMMTSNFRKSNSYPTLEEVKFTLVQFSNLDRLSKLKNVIESL